MGETIMRARGRGERIGDIALRLLLLFLVVFSLLPLITLSIFSVNDFPYYSLPFRGFTTHWYSELVRNQQIGPSLTISVQIALGSAILATCLGGLFTMGAARPGSKRLRWLLGLGFAPLVTPTLMIAIGLQVLFVRIGLPLSPLTVIIGHVTTFTPLVVLVVSARLANFEWSLVDAARDLGAGPWTAFRTAVLPTIGPGLFSGFLITFLMSFNDFVIGFFTGRGFVTLPSLIYSMQRVGISPMLLAYGTVLVIAALVAALTARGALVGIAKKRGEVHV